MLLNATGLSPPGQIHTFSLKNISGDRIQVQVPYLASNAAWVSLNDMFFYL